MSLKCKMLLLACLTVLTLFFVSGCAGEATPYQINDKENYTVSVKFDANGGAFTTNTSVTMDSYNLSEVHQNSAGEAQIPLLSPDNSLRGKDAYTAQNSGYFLAGWYAQRTEAKDDSGNIVYTYGEKWDFESDVLTVPVNGTYSSAEPVLTLYAAWVPVFQVEFYDLASGELCGTLDYNPTEMSELLIPQWDQETGAIDMQDFPEREGYTFNGVFFDDAGTQSVDGESLCHTGTVDYETGTAQNGTMKLYVDWMEGEWYHIYTAEQFVKNASGKGSYVIHADLDFSDEIWPTSMMYGNFNGTIQGNGHTFRNIELTQTNNSKVNAGLFGSLSEAANIRDLTFENVTFTIKAGTRVVGTSYGLLAGTIADGMTLSNVSVKESTLQINSGCYFGADDYSIGLICGMGDGSAVDPSGITCAAVGDEPEKVIITLDDGMVNLEFVSA